MSFSEIYHIHQPDAPKAQFYVVDGMVVAGTNVAEIVRRTPEIPDAPIKDVLGSPQEVCSSQMQQATGGAALRSVVRPEYL